MPETTEVRCESLGALIYYALLENMPNAVLLYGKHKDQLPKHWRIKIDELI